MKTVIMAGGRGTRIREVNSDIPKPLIEIGGVPVLEREIYSLKKQGFTDIIITVSYMADKIISYFQDGRKMGVKIEYYIEKSPLGNAGALFKIKDKLDDDFLLLNADSVFDIDFNRFVNYHKNKKGLATIFTHPNSHPYDSSIVIADKDGRVQKWLAKEDDRPKWYKNRVNAGLHIINPKVLNMIEIDDRLIGDSINGAIVKVDLDRQVLKPLCKRGQLFCYDSPEYVKDMGTPDRYELVNRDFCNGIIEKKNLMNKQKAVFLDRDGTINKYIGFLKNINDFELLSGVSDAIRAINELGYLVIVITNQPVIARGEVSVEELNAIHDKMETLLGQNGAYLDGIYYCPHHPNGGYSGEIHELKIDCMCRKPKPGLLIQAAEDFNVDLNQSWMVGDSENDIIAGQAAGCKTALIGTDFYGQNLSVGNLLEFVKFI